MTEHCCNLKEHEACVEKAGEIMPTVEEIDVMASRFKVLSEQSRLKILFALCAGEMCVEHITKAVSGNQSAVSHQLKTLKYNKIIKCKRAGKQMIYSLADEHILKIIELAKEHLHCE